MSHEVETMMSIEMPWHRLGTRVAGLQTAKEAIAAAGLDWMVETLPIYRLVNEKPVEISDYKALARVTDGMVYNVVTNEYCPAQNADCFDFFDAVVGTGAAKYETAGSLRNGAIVWMQAKMNQSLKIGGEEMTEHLLLVNSHDATWALQMYFTSRLVVCMNTLRASSEQRMGSTFYHKHTSSIKERMMEAQEVLGLANLVYAKFNEQAQYLATHQLPAANVPKLLTACLELKPELAVTPYQTSVMDRITELLETCKVSDNSLRGTKWNALMAVSEYVDHEKRHRNGDDGKLYQIWFGTGQQMKDRAFNFLMKDS